MRVGLPSMLQSGSGDGKESLWAPSLGRDSGEYAPHGNQGGIYLWGEGKEREGGGSEMEEMR